MGRGQDSGWQDHTAPSPALHPPWSVPQSSREVQPWIISSYSCSIPPAPTPGPQPNLIIGTLAHLPLPPSSTLEEASSLHPKIPCLAMPQALRADIHISPGVVPSDGFCTHGDSSQEPSRSFPLSGGSSFSCLEAVSSVTPLTSDSRGTRTYRSPLLQP